MQCGNPRGYLDLNEVKSVTGETLFYSTQTISYFVRSSARLHRRAFEIREEKRSSQPDLQIEWQIVNMMAFMSEIATGSSPAIKLDQTVE